MASKMSSVLRLNNYELKRYNVLKLVNKLNINMPNQPSYDKIQSFTKDLFHYRIPKGYTSP